MLKNLRHARLNHTHEKEMRALLAADLLIIDDFALDAMDAQESRDAHEIIYERHRDGSMIVLGEPLDVRGRNIYACLCI